MDPIGIGAIAVGVIVVGLIGYQIYQSHSAPKTNPDGTPVETPASKLSNAVSDLLAEIKKDAKLSVASRSAICTALILIDTAVEVLPDDAQKTAGRESVKQIGALFIVNPSPK